MITPPTVGVQGVQGYLPDDLIRDVALDITEYGRASGKIMTWLSHTPANMQQTGNADYWYQEEVWDQPNFILQGGLTGGAATEAGVVILSPEFAIGDTISHPDSGQYMIIDAAVRTVDDTDDDHGGYTTVTLRGVGGNIAAVVGDMTVVNCGIAMADKAYFPEPKGSKPKQLSNTVTYRGYSTEVSFQEGMATAYAGSKMQRDNQRALVVTKLAMERDLTFSNYEVKTGYTQTNARGSSGSSEIRFTRGLTSSITKNVQTYTGDCTQETFEEFLATSIFANYQHGSDSKMVFWGPTGRRRLTQDFGTKVRYVSGPGANKYGIQIEKYTDFEGHNLYFMTEDNLRGLSPYDLGCLVLDGQFIKLRHHGSNMMEMFDSSEPGRTTRSISTWFNYGLELRFDAAHGILKQAS